MNPWESGVWYLGMVVNAAVLVRLASTGLYRLYKRLFLYLSVDLAVSILASTLTFKTSEYARFYFGAQTVKLAIAALVVVEVYWLALENQPALAQYGRDMVGYVLLAVAVVACAGLLVDPPAALAQFPVLVRFRTFERTMNVCLATFLILICVFMAWFPVRLRRNVVIYIGGFVTLFLSRATAVYLANHLHEQSIHTVNMVTMSVTLGCLLAWLVMMRREGETRTAIVGHRWNLADAERLTTQLDAINHALERLRHK